MLKPSTIVAAAAVVGFVSVLVYRVSASDAAGLLQRSLREPVIATGVAVEFVIERCEPSVQTGELATNAGIAAADTPRPVASSGESNNAAPAVEPGTHAAAASSQSIIDVPQTIDHSPSVLYLP